MLQKEQVKGLLSFRIQGEFFDTVTYETDNPKENKKNHQEFTKIKRHINLKKCTIQNVIKRNYRIFYIQYVVFIIYLKKNFRHKSQLYYKVARYFI